MLTTSFTSCHVHESPHFSPRLSPLLHAPYLNFRSLRALLEVESLNLANMGINNSSIATLAATLASACSVGVRGSGGGSTAQRPAPCTSHPTVGKALEGLCAENVPSSPNSDICACVCFYLHRAYSIACPPPRVFQASTSRVLACNPALRAGRCPALPASALWARFKSKRIYLLN